MSAPSRAAPRTQATKSRPDIGLAARLFDELGARTGGPKGVTRASYGEGEQIAHAIVEREAKALGLRISRDAALNLFVTLPGQERKPAIIIGSHLDSVPRGGNFDGAAGVLAGLAVLAGFVRAEIRPPRDVVVMAIRAEESAWFNASYIGSRAAFGRLTAPEIDGVVRSDDRRTLGEHMAAAGADIDALRAGARFLDPSRIGAFIEPHIEQGPLLAEHGAPIAIVTGIRGGARFRTAACLGEYAHSGATPRAARRDAVLAVAELAIRLETLWRRLESEGEDCTFTIGQFSTDPAGHAFSKVAGRVDFSLDMRSQSPAWLARAPDEIRIIVEDIGRRRGVTFDLGALTGTAPALMDEALVAALTRAASAEGHVAPRMACGAGHDAAVFANLSVPTGMIFIRNEHGSHNPREAMALADFAAAAATLSRFCLDPSGLRG